MLPIAMRLAAVLVATSLMPLAAFALEGRAQENAAFGNPAPLSTATHTITVHAGTRYVTVDQGEVVRFDIEGQSFVWQFDTLDTRSFDLAAIAPVAVKVGRIRVYVRENPLYRN